MKKIISLTIFTFTSLFVWGQQSEHLLRYRTLALDYNHDLKAAQKSIQAAVDIEKSAKADRNPKLAAGASFNFTGQPTSLTLNMPSIENPISFEAGHMQYGASVSIMQPVYTGGKILETIRSAQHQQSFSVANSQVVRSAICYQTDVQYWSTVARRELVAISEDFTSSISSLVKTIQERVEVGLTDPQDLLMAQVKLNEAQYQLLESKSNFETGVMALNSLIGANLTTRAEIDSVIFSVTESDTMLFSRSSIRPEIVAAESKIAFAKSSLKLNDARFKPQIYVGADGTYSSPGYNFKPDLNPNYALYAKVSVPIFEWGKRKSEKRAANQQVGIANDNLNKVEDAVNLEVQTAKLSLHQAMERVKLSDNSLKIALENEKKAVEKYNEGKSSVIEVIEAQTYRQTAQVNHVKAKVETQNYYCELLRALNVYNCM